MASKLSNLVLNALKSAAISPRAPIRIPPVRAFCTGTTSEPSSGASFDPSVLDQPREAPVYGKLTGTGRNALKTDIIHLLDGCDLNTEDIKVEYNWNYNPTAMIVQFPSRSAYETGLRVLRAKRIYRMDKVDRSQWDLLEAYNGKVVMLQGIPRNALAEDIERFLSGCNFDASNMKVFLRSSVPDPVKVALVHFPSEIEAMHAFRVKNRGFCLNNTVSMRVLQ